MNGVVNFVHVVYTIHCAQNQMLCGAWVAVRAFVQVVSLDVFLWLTVAEAKIRAVRQNCPTCAKNSMPTPSL